MHLAHDGPPQAAAAAAEGVIREHGACGPDALDVLCLGWFGYHPRTPVGLHMAGAWAGHPEPRIPAPGCRLSMLPVGSYLGQMRRRPPYD